MKSLAGHGQTGHDRQMDDIANTLIALIVWLRSITLSEWILFGCFIVLGLSLEALFAEPIAEWLHRNTYL